MRSIVRVVVLCAVAATLCFPAAGARAATCEELASLPIAHGSVRSAEIFAGGTLTDRNRSFTDLPSFCRVRAVLSPAAGSDITVELWLPDRAIWNGKMLGTGNGGFGGFIRYDMLSSGVRRNYATANTDMGTAAAKGAYGGGIGQTEMIKDWGYRSTHEMTVAAKEIIAAYYGKPPDRSYFNGCSTGGHQGLSEAQRYPSDYDGIVAGAPGHNRTHLHTEFLYFFRIAHDRPEAHLSADEATSVRTAVLSACVGRDGGAPTDSYLTSPTECRFDPRSLLCRPGQEAGLCLTAAQISTLEKAYAGARNPRTGALIYPGVAKGSERSLALLLGPPNARPQDARADLVNWVKAANWDAATFDFDHDVAELDAKFGPDINALSTDLRAFRERGGKLILFHGWEDVIVSPYDSITYFERLAPGFARLFMLPGVSHCSGGSGPDVFGAEFNAGDSADPDHDIVAALDRWVTGGAAPERIIATKYATGAPNSPRIATATRPLCAYPKVARYDGTGDVTRADSFTCVEGPPARFERPAPEYLQQQGRIPDAAKP